MSRSATVHYLGIQPRGFATCVFPLAAPARLHRSHLAKQSATSISVQLLTFRK